MPNKKSIQDQFTEYVISDDLLGLATEFIQQNMEPDDVFESGELDDWAKKYIVDQYDAEEIYDDGALHDWAIAHGFVKEGV